MQVNYVNGKNRMTKKDEIIFWGDEGEEYLTHTEQGDALHDMIESDFDYIAHETKKTPNPTPEWVKRQFENARQQVEKWPKAKQEWAKQKRRCYKTINLLKQQSLHLIL
jgi:hypothetical protein